MVGRFEWFKESSMVNYVCDRCGGRIDNMCYQINVQPHRIGPYAGDGVCWFNSQSKHLCDECYNIFSHIYMGKTPKTEPEIKYAGSPFSD